MTVNDQNEDAYSSRAISSALFGLALLANTYFYFTWRADQPLSNPGGPVGSLGLWVKLWGFSTVTSGAVALKHLRSSVNYWTRDRSKYRTKFVIALRRLLFCVALAPLPFRYPLSAFALVTAVGLLVTGIPILGILFNRQPRTSFI